MLPQQITILHVTFPLLLVLVVLCLFVWLFVIWYEGNKDGFDEYKLLDIAFLSLIVSFGLGYGVFRLTAWLAIYYPTNILLRVNSPLLICALVLWAAYATVVFIVKKRHWSEYRVLDIYALADTLSLLVLCIGLFLLTRRLTYIYATLSFLAMYLFVLRFRGYKFVSGTLFTVFNLVLMPIGLLFFRQTNYLLLYVIQFTISLLNLYLIRKRIMLSSEFINKIKRILLSKKRDLTEEGKLLKEEDPYTQPGRDTDNADYIDDTELEDTEKVVYDAEEKDVSDDKLQVNKALSAMDKGSYGICENCGKPIDKARLQAYPETTLCLECAERLEKEKSLAE
jgi:RNA polymerase-binding transcription factor DksA